MLEKEKKKEMSFSLVIYHIDHVIIWCQSSVRDDVLFADLYVWC